MLGHVGVGPGKQQAVVGDLRRGGPDLLAVDDEVHAIALGPGGQAGQVRSGARLAEQLAPGVLAGQHGAHVLALQLIAAVRDDCRRGE
jgi:hypothetical protein